MTERGDKPEFWSKRTPRTKDEAEQVYRFIHGSKRWDKFKQSKNEKAGRK